MSLPACESIPSPGQHSAYSTALIAAALGDTERAIRALERAAEEEPHRFGRLLNEPELEGVRDNPRVRALRNRFRLP